MNKECRLQLFLGSSANSRRITWKIHDRARTPTILTVIVCQTFRRHIGNTRNRRIVCDERRIADERIQHRVGQLGRILGGEHEKKTERTTLLTQRGHDTVIAVSQQAQLVTHEHRPLASLIPILAMREHRIPETVHEPAAENLIHTFRQRITIMRCEHNVIIASMVENVRPSHSATTCREHVFDGKELIHLVQRGVRLGENVTVGTNRMTSRVRTAIQLLGGTGGIRHLLEHVATLQFHTQRAAHMTQRFRGTGLTVGTA